MITGTADDMPARKSSKRSLLAERIQDVELIDEAVWAELKRSLAPVSDSYLRSLLRDSGRPMSPLIEGVHISNLEGAERTLRALACEYEGADAFHGRLCRDLVIDAKQRARWWLQRATGTQTSKGQIKQEILLWTSTWLDNPSLFQDWVSLRRQRLLTGDRTTQP